MRELAEGQDLIQIILNIILGFINTILRLFFGTDMVYTVT